MTDKITTRSMGSLTAYTLNGTTIVFGFRPLLMVGVESVWIDKPERFGGWETIGERRAFIRAFVASLKTEGE